MFNKSVQQVIASFNKTIAELGAIAKREDARIVSLAIEENRILDHKKAAIEEAAAARRIADKLSKLVE